MSGGNTTQELTQGVLGASLIASNVMTGGADTPLDAIALGGDAGGGAFIPAAGMDSGLFSSAVGGMGSGLTDTAGISSLMPSASQLVTGAGAANSLLNSGFSPEEIQAINQGTAEGSNAVSPYYPTASNSGTPLVPINNATNVTVPNSDAVNQGIASTVQNDAYESNYPTADQINASNPGMGPNATMPTEQTSSTPWYQSAYDAVTNNKNSSLYNPNGMNLAQKGLLGGAGIATLLALKNSGAMNPNYLKPYNPTSAASMGLGTQMGANYAPNRASQWGYATGGVATPANVMPADLQQQPQLPSQVQQLMSQYGVTPQEVSQTTQALGVSQPATKMAQGGITSLKEGSFVVPADVVSHFGNGSTDAGLEALHNHLGAEPIRGHGDGMSDSIPTDIDGKQPARVANGEALVHPEKVKELGNGSADAGAKKLYAMMDKVRKARTGNSKQGKQIKAAKYLPT
jgi:hypothetical protein